MVRSLGGAPLAQAQGATRRMIDCQPRHVVGGLLGRLLATTVLRTVLRAILLETAWWAQVGVVGVALTPDVELFSRLDPPQAAVIIELGQDYTVRL